MINDNALSYKKKHNKFYKEISTVTCTADIHKFFIFCGMKMICNYPYSLEDLKSCYFPYTRLLLALQG